MGIYLDLSVIYGVRILEANEEGDYYTHQEFTDNAWKEEARQGLLPYEESPTKKIQVLCPCQTTHTTGAVDDSFLIWIDTVRPLAELLLWSQGTLFLLKYRTTPMIFEDTMLSFVNPR